MAPVPQEQNRAVPLSGRSTLKGPCDAQTVHDASALVG